MKYIFFTLNIIMDLGAHFLLFFIWMHFLPLNNIYVQIAAAAVLLMFLALTVIAPLLIHWRDNIWTRSLYLSIALWAGFMLNTVLFAIIFFLLNFLGIDFINSAKLKTVYIILLPLLLLLPEAWLAQTIKVKKITVKIKNLPEAWHNKNILHLSDVHLGPIWRQRFFDSLVAKINALQAEAILITGDLFDGMDTDFSWFHKRKLIAPKGVYYSFGNHDIILGRMRVKSLLADSGITILDDEIMVVDDLQILGLSCYYEGGLDVRHKIIDEMKYQAKQASILMYHEPKDVSVIKELGINLQLSGHTHGGQMFPFNLVAKLLYRGFAAGLYRLGDFNLLVNVGAGTWGPPLRLATRSEVVLINLVKAS